MVNEEGIINSPCGGGKWSANIFDLENEFVVKRKNVRDCELQMRLGVIEDMKLPSLKVRLRFLVDAAKTFLSALGHLSGRKRRIAWYYLLINEKGEQAWLSRNSVHAVTPDPVDYQIEI